MENRPLALHDDAIMRSRPPDVQPPQPKTVPPHVWFGVSAVFHYLGPSLAVLLFPAVGVLGVAWFRIASAAAIFAPITRPVDHDRGKPTVETRLLLVALGACLAVMNTAFYLALDRLPMSLRRRDGVRRHDRRRPLGSAHWTKTCSRSLSRCSASFVLIDVKWSTDPLGLFWSALNALLFVGYIVLRPQIGRRRSGDRRRTPSVPQWLSHSSS